MSHPKFIQITSDQKTEFSQGALEAFGVKVARECLCPDLVPENVRCAMGNEDACKAIVQRILGEYGFEAGVDACRASIRARSEGGK